MKRFFSFMVIILLAIYLISGCTGSDNGGSNNSTPTPTPGTNSTPGPTPTAKATATPTSTPTPGPTPVPTLMITPMPTLGAPSYDDSSTASYQISTRTTKQLSAVSRHYKDNGSTVYNSTTYSQQVNVLTQKCDQNAKLVTWAVEDTDKVGYKRYNVATIAQDYEAKHPGWKVVGGINADQYYPSYGTGGTADGKDYFYPQPYGCMIADGEKWFSICAKPYTTGNGSYLSGFLNDGSTDQILEGRTGWTITPRFSLAGLYVSIYNASSQLIGKYLIEKFNEAPGDNESTLYSPYVQVGPTIPPLPVTGTNICVVGNADQSYVSNSITYTYKPDTNNAQNAFFGKGVITSIGGTSTTLVKGQFAIDTRNSSLGAALQVGSRIMVQFEYVGPINEVESATAYHTIMRSNDQDVTSTSSYNTSHYPRSFFGRKADGTMVLIAVDGSQGGAGMYGTNQYEGCALLKYYGVVEAYQMDGGGSVTMVVRDNNNLVVVNSPSDGSPQAVLSALLFVVPN